MYTRKDQDAVLGVADRARNKMHAALLARCLCVPMPHLENSLDGRLRFPTATVLRRNVFPFQRSCRRLVLQLRLLCPSLLVWPLFFPLLLVVLWCSNTLDWHLVLPLSHEAEIRGTSGDVRRLDRPLPRIAETRIHRGVWTRVEAGEGHAAVGVAEANSGRRFPSDLQHARAEKGSCGLLRGQVELARPWEIHDVVHADPALIVHASAQVPILAQVLGREVILDLAASLDFAHSGALRHRRQFRKRRWKHPWARRHTWHRRR
mmetsp:Transcript_103857/g.263784  ORF Transcript_103857/g.263784 Transcript_103857/m.263784 type:complete len:262 (+) Transcript_103857:367-1152(+)